MSLRTHPVCASVSSSWEAVRAVVMLMLAGMLDYADGVRVHGQACTV